MLLAHGKDNPIPSENRLFHFIALDSKTFCSYGEPRRIEPRRVPIDRAFPSRAIDSLILRRFYASVSFKTTVWFCTTGDDYRLRLEAVPPIARGSKQERRMF